MSSKSDELFYSTAYIAASNADCSWTGSGFICRMPSRGGVLPILVTNRHVLQDATEISIRMVASTALGTPADTAISMTLEGDEAALWRGHPDPTIDVAVLAFSEFLYSIELHTTQPFWRAFGYEDFVTQNNQHEVDSIESVTFVGYPDGMYDRQNFLPIARRGQTATPISVDYEGKPMFLIDASVFPGSSGSPVVLIDPAPTFARGEEVAMRDPRFMLLGVLAAVHTRDVQGEVHEVATKLVAEIRQPLNLGVVYKAQTIYECAEAMFAEYGIPLDGWPIVDAANGP